jgi:hypothetical protein
VINVLVRFADGPPSDLGSVADELREVHARLEPLHPGTEDGALAGWYRVVVDDPATANRVAAALRESPTVESAYVEPPSAPPQ